MVGDEMDMQHIGRLWKYDTVSCLHCTIVPLEKIC